MVGGVDWSSRIPALFGTGIGSPRGGRICRPPFVSAVSRRPPPGNHSNRHQRSHAANCRLSGWTRGQAGATLGNAREYPHCRIVGRNSRHQPHRAGRGLVAFRLSSQSQHELAGSVAILRHRLRPGDAHCQSARSGTRCIPCEPGNSIFQRRAANRYRAGFVCARQRARRRDRLHREPRHLLAVDQPRDGRRRPSSRTWGAPLQLPLATPRRTPRWRQRRGQRHCRTHPVRFTHAGQHPDSLRSRRRPGGVGHR